MKPLLIKRFFYFATMDKEQLINQTIVFVKETLKEAEGGHDWFHIQRVYNNAKLIAQGEQVDLLVVELGALLHDIADSKFHQGDETIGPKKAVAFLRSLEVDEDLIAQVADIIKNISFKVSLDQNKKETPKSEALKVVQDADRLDAIGAIGIARAFNYGGYKNRALYDPEIAPELDLNKERYKKSSAPTINHFYEKLLGLKNQMNTAKGREMAEKRHRFMELYLQQFYDEWEGKL